MIIPNVLLSFFPRPLMVLFLLTFLSAGAGLAQASIEKHAGPNASAHHTIGISFELDQSLVIGTSKIDLPAGRSLHLDCGPLTITGAVLEEKDHTPVHIRPEKNAKENVIIIGARPLPQVVRLSWTLHAADPYASGNLIGKDGITLAGFWHPVAEQDMLFELSARLPRGFTAVSEGNPLHGRTRTHLYHAQIPYPMQALHFAAGPYKIRSRKIGPVTISSYFFAEDQNLAPAYLEKAVGYIKRYEKLIGPFPYPEYKIVENRLPTGYGMPGFTLLGQAVVRLPFIKDTSLGHEILHSWFGNSVGLAPSGGNWCEGLTTYLADQSFATDTGKGRKYRKNQILRYLAYVHPDNSMALKDFTGAGDGRPMARKIRAIGYDKGSMVFHMLEKEIGSTSFIQGLRELYRTKKNQRASWQDIEKIFARVSGKDLTLFFDQWLQRTDIPRLRIAQISVHQKNGRSITRFHLMQENKVPYSLQVKVVVHSLTGTTTTTLHTDQLDQEFSISTDSLPTQLVLDPDYDLMRGLDNDEIPPTLSRFLGADKKTIVLPDNAQEAAVYQPLADLLGRLGVAAKKASELHNADLAQGSFLFAGDSDLRKSLFGNKKFPYKKPSGHGFGLL
ncbi:MAG TPA: M1 family peptidase, partial [Desulfobulbaceae bacterium]|nr:M1 family peptidase [Desulfobulbaceae bacterium]